VNTTLTHLELHGNRMYYKGAAALAEVLATSEHNLRYIDLSNNHMTYPGVVVIQEAVDKCNANRLLQGKPSLEAKTDSNYVLEEILNSTTHGIGLLLSLIGMGVALEESWGKGYKHICSVGVFTGTLVLLYTSSCLYHSFFKLGTTKKIFQRLDHCAIYTLIAGTYTPILVINFDGWWGRYYILAIQWVLAITGITLDCAAPNKHQNLSLCLYLLMGWIIVAVFPSGIFCVPLGEMALMGIGGLAYTGGVWFFVKGDTVPVYHSYWHIFVMLGSFFHYLAILFYVVPVSLPNLSSACCIAGTCSYDIYF